MPKPTSEQITDLKRAIMVVEELRSYVDDIIQPTYGECHQVDSAISDASDDLSWLAEYWEACIIETEQELIL